MDYYAASLELHAAHRGKIAVESKVPLATRDDLSIAYTPGVAEPCRAIAADPASAYTYTAKGNTVAVVSDGSAVLGLGNIGAAAAAPVMEGKCVLFKQFGGVDAFPLCLDTQDTEEIIRIVRAISPVFGGINLEDISSPRCFEIEARLEAELDIPVFHDDQHGTAVVVTAALTNALKLTGRTFEGARVVLSGPGAAGTAITRMLLAAGVRDIICCDRTGALVPGRAKMDAHKAALAEETNPRRFAGTLAEALVGADVFIGVSGPGIVTQDMVRGMAANPIVFAMANPVPEIMYEDALAAGAAVVGTGRSDTPNQINNVLAFPGIFRGALNARARDINREMKLAAARAIASLITDEELAAGRIIPSALDPRVAASVAAAVAEAARATGVARV